ncbi:MAG: hypothetical protein IT531_00105 [Burkholderiales bacterium]|nr:hypothetical protein [Burkholderiales bacterium]
MSLRDYLIRKLGGVPQPQARLHVMQVGALAAGRNRDLAPGVRVGTWVRWVGRTGIATGKTPDGLIAIDIVNDTGETVLSTHQPWASMRKATLDEIPTARRPSADAAHKLGYLES